MRLFFLMIGLILFAICDSNAQNTRFISSGSIQYERKINLFTLYNDEEHKQYLEFLRKNGEQFRKEHFNLKFNKEKTQYYPQPNATNNFKFEKLPSDDNVVYTDLINRTFTSNKNVLEKKYYINDTIKRIQWKLTGETRIIAGFECKRANAIIFDSIYVVAFFSEEILTEGGPECFNGLPGMILGVALPNEHITWFATSVTSVDQIKINEVPHKEKMISNLELKKNLKQHFEISSKTGNWNYKFSLL